MSKPIDLIVASFMFDMNIQIDNFRGVCTSLGIRNQRIPDALPDYVAVDVARTLLAQIAREADAAKIYAALKVVGAPCSTADISDGIAAARDRIESEKTK